MKYFMAALILLFCLVFSSCIEFEREKLTFVHDDKTDELKMTLVYEGIFGNLDKGQNSQKDRNDSTTKDKLNQLQIKQLETVLKENKAFFFSNWIAEYSSSSSPRMIEEMIKRNEHGQFAEPEKKLLELLLQNIEVQNIGFYKNKHGKLCGAQTVRIGNVSKVLESANEVIRRQVIAHIPQFRQELENKTPSAWSSQTIDLIESKLKKEFQFIRLEGNLLTFSTIMAEAEQQTLSHNILKDWPSGTRIEFLKDGMEAKIGGKEDKFTKMKKQCFDCYQPNALNYIVQEHGNLLHSPKKIRTDLNNFLNLSAKTD